MSLGEAGRYAFPDHFPNQTQSNLLVGPSPIESVRKRLQFLTFQGTQHAVLKGMDRSITGDAVAARRDRGCGTIG